MRVVFMGTPDFAAASLQKLIDSGFEIAGVFTQPDRPKGRGMELVYPPVKELALRFGLPVFQPEKLRDGTALELLRQLKPDVLAVVAYGRILPDEILALPRYGAVNVHGSLLPKYRGSAPIQWAVLNGDKITGVSTMYLAHEMDSGDIIYTAETEIGEFETSGELFDRLKDLGAGLLVKTLEDIRRGCLLGPCGTLRQARPPGRPRTTAGPPMPRRWTSPSAPSIGTKAPGRSSNRSRASSPGRWPPWSWRGLSTGSLPPPIPKTGRRRPPAAWCLPGKRGSSWPAPTGRPCGSPSFRPPARSA